MAIIDAGRALNIDPKLFSVNEMDFKTHVGKTGRGLPLDVLRRMAVVVGDSTHRSTIAAKAAERILHGESEVEERLVREKSPSRAKAIDGALPAGSSESGARHMLKYARKAGVPCPLLINAMEQQDALTPAGQKSIGQ